MFNAMDFLIILMFLAIIGVGFLNGVSRVSSAIVAIYFAAVFAAAVYRPMTEFAQRYLTTMGAVTGQLVFFLLLFFLFSVGFTMILSSWLGGIRLPRRIEIADNVGGAALGVIVSGLAMTLAAMLLTIMVQVLNQTLVFSGRVAVLGFIRGEIDHSTLVPIFLDMAPFFTRLLAPWFPGGLPPILAGVPQG